MDVSRWGWELRQFPFKLDGVEPQAGPLPPRPAPHTSCPYFLPYATSSPGCIGRAGNEGRCRGATEVPRINPPKFINYWNNWVSPKDPNTTAHRHLFPGNWKEAGTMHGDKGRMEEESSPEETLTEKSLPINISISLPLCGFLNFPGEARLLNITALLMYLG